MDYARMSADQRKITELEAKLRALEEEYDQEVISHDIEEKDLRTRLREAEKSLQEALAQIEQLKLGNGSIRELP